ncbi:coiled-coil domain-containing protein 191 [Chanos chanos]|uniref:Coiled-coil domain-containing protein 191 n=1 Tax=Chanos chanos TaxID=29144 RepID=A0A6J2UUJ3_CHACN|nr:coiled-coil domain-containing protein 191 [Chanos chanos]
MAYPGHKQDIFRWKRITKNKTLAGNKVQANNDDIDQWIKRVEMASQFAISEVFSKQKTYGAKPSHVVALQSMDQLQDHDDSYTEAQSLLSDWMNRKLRLELEMDEEEEEEMKDSPEAKPSGQPVSLNYSNFDDMYSHLAEQEETAAVGSFLQELMESEVLGSEIVHDLHLDSEREKRKWKTRNPSVTMEMRHRQVKENRARRDAERTKHWREREVQKEAQEEVQKLEQEAQRRRRQEERRQEELLQQEMTRLRKQMEERRKTEQLVRCMERERSEKKRGVQTAEVPKPLLSSTQKLQDTKLQQRLQQVEAKVHINNLKCMQRHFSAWYCVLLEKRVWLGKAAALCDWRRQLRAWRAWRALVWLRKEEREAERTEQELRQDHRRCQIALEGDRRRILGRYFRDWRLWCRMASERRELLRQQEETRRKMAALISAAASGKLVAEPPHQTPPPPLPPPPPPPVTSAPPSSAVTDGAPRFGAPPTQAWQVTRRHATLSAAELRRAKLVSAPSVPSAEARDGRFENRYRVQQRLIADQTRLLKEQQEQIALLRERQNVLELQQQAERTAPAQQAMEERAQQRAERRREVEEMKKKREEDRLAQMRAEEEERHRKEEEEKAAQAERRREERRRQREREQQRQQRLEREQLLSQQASEHYHRTLLHNYGLTPWKRMIDLCHGNAQLAGDHHRRTLLRRCLSSWRRAADEAQAAKRASAHQLYQRTLLHKALSSWKRVKDVSVVQEARAERFYRARTLRRFFAALLGHVTEERLAAWDQEQLAVEHSKRRAVCRCFAAWRRLPGVLREERERETRREQLRRKVAEILPDYRPSPRNDVWSPAPGF